MNLPQNHLHCFVTPADRADEPLCREVLSGQEMKKARAFRFDRDRRLSITARAQVRYLLSGYTGERPEKILFSLGEKGKPRVCPGTAGEQIDFNVSHSSGLVVSVFSRDHEVGADVEGMDRTVDLDIARRFFREAECRRIMSAPEPERPRLFLRFWTLKEAWAKAWGLGLGAGLDKICFDLSSPGSIGYATEDPADAGNWQFYQFYPAPGAVAALAVSSDRPLSLSVFHCLPFEGIRPLDTAVVSSGSGLYGP